MNKLTEVIGASLLFAALSVQGQGNKQLDGNIGEVKEAVGSVLRDSKTPVDLSGLLYYKDISGIDNSGPDLSTTINQLFGAVHIPGDVTKTGTISSNVGDVIIGGNLKGQVNTNTGNVRVGGINYGTIVSQTGDIIVGSLNKSLERFVGVNYGTISTIAGEINIGNILVKVIKFEQNNGANSSNTIQNGKVIVGDYSKFVVFIDGLYIDVINRKLISTGQNLTLHEAKEMGFDISDDFREVIYKGQRIVLDNGVTVEAMR